MTTGMKTYNDSINIDPEDIEAPTIAHHLQEQGFAIGVVTSVPFSHATPACAYAHNVWRDDYRTSRAILSASHRSRIPTNRCRASMCYLAAAGARKSRKMTHKAKTSCRQHYLAPGDLAAIDAEHGGNI